MDQTITFKLEFFEGPLDLLLHLVSKSKVSIYDVRISDIVDQYLTYINAMQMFDAEVTSEFVEMAARLLFIKSRELLPVYDEGDEQDSEEKLRQDLIEYMRFKNLGEYFRKRSEIGRDIYIKQPEPVERERTYAYLHSAEELFSALRVMLERGERKLPPPVESFAGIVGREPVTVESRTLVILTLLKNRGSVFFERLFDDIQNRSEAVATFLALLDLCKNRRIAVSEKEGLYIISVCDGDNNDQQGT